MADFEAIIKKYQGEDGGIPSDATAKLAKAISTAVGNEFVEKSRYKAKLEEIDTLTSEKQTAEDSAAAAEKWKTKYDALKEDFDNYKADQASKAAREAKEKAYGALLKEAGVSEKRIAAVLKVSDVDSVELDADGRIKDAGSLAAGIREEWSDFIVTTSPEGAATPTPPGNAAEKGAALDAMSLAEKMQYANEHPKEYAELTAKK